jgi:CrcB protein
MATNVISFLLVGAGGLCGSVLRFGVTTLAGLSSLDTFLYPVQTFILNNIGSFIIGLLVNKTGTHWYYFLSTGLCGGLTTFSAFALEIARMFTKKKFANAIIYAFLTLCCCVGCAYLSYWLVAIRSPPAQSSTDSVERIVNP